MRWPTLVLIPALALGAAPRLLAASDRPPVRREAPGDAQLEREVLDLVNRHRGTLGLRPLALDAAVSGEARRHSAAMAAGTRPFGHDGFADRIAALRHVMSCRSGAENVAASLGYDHPAAEFLRGWLASRAHRKNLEGPYDTTGIGVARSAAGKVYCTQIFVER